MRVAGHDDIDEPCGSARATGMISSFGSQDERSRGFEKSVHRPPACAATTITVAPPAPQPPGFGFNGLRERRDAKAADVGGNRREQRSRRHDPDDADPHACRGDDVDGLTFRKSTGRPVAGVDQVRGEKRKGRLRGARLQRASRIVVRPLRRGRPDRPGRSRIRGCRWRPRHSRARCRRRRRPSPRSGSTRACPGTCRRRRRSRTAPPSPGAGRAQVRDVTAEQREAATILTLQDAAVQVVGADNREGDGFPGWRVGRDRRTARAARAADRERGKRRKESSAPHVYLTRYRITPAAYVDGAKRPAGKGLRRGGNARRAGRASRKRAPTHSSSTGSRSISSSARRPR